MPKLKVFRTTVGFHDACVATPSRAAALRAWGSSTDLFAMGAAEEVTDPALMKDALANPGVIMKRSRGTASEHLAIDAERKTVKKAAPRVKAKPAPPRPSRANVDAAEKRLAEAQAKAEKVTQKLDEEETALAAKRRAITERHKRRIEELEASRETEDNEYRAALDQWRLN